jgi:hypothetical protein
MSDREQLANMAKTVITLENKYDSSMRGVFIDLLVTEYVNNKVEEMVKMFDHVLTNQKEIRDTYGDVDTAMTKLKVLGKTKTYHDMESSTTGMFLEDIFCGFSFIICKETLRPREDETVLIAAKEQGEASYLRCLEIMSENHFYIKRYAKKPSRNTISLDVFQPGWINFKKTHYTKKFEHEIGRGMLYHYQTFEESFRALREIFIEMTDPRFA